MRVHESSESIDCDQNIYEVVDLFRASDVTTYIDYKLAGTNIDIVIADGKRTIGFDLIGFPGRFVDAFPLERYLMFKRANLDVYPVSYFDWINNRVECKKYINKLISKNGPGILLSTNSEI